MALKRFDSSARQPKYDDLPIIAVTANVLRNDHERYLKLGMNDVVTKPISSERLAHGYHLIG